MQRLVRGEIEVGKESTPSHGQPESLRPRSRWLRILILLAALAILGFVVVLASKWPFTRSKVTADLEGALHARVQIGKFHQTWLPPGGVAEDVTFTGNGTPSNSAPITVRKLTIRSSFHGLFTRHIALLQVDGARVIAPNAEYFSPGKQQSQSGPKQESGSAQEQSNSKTVVDQFIAVNSVLEFSDGDGNPPLQFAISRLELSSPDVHGTSAFQISVHNPKPPGDIQASGHLGPWTAGNFSETNVAGSYSFQHADLSSFHGIAGTLSSEGSFRGTLRQVEVSGKTVTPDFEVTETDHKIPLDTEFLASVITKPGNTSLESVHARLVRSGIEAEGNIKQNDSGKGRITAVNLQVREGRIQDFLFLFLKDSTAPLTGRFDFKGHALLPPENAPFKEKVQLEGDFGIGGGHLSNPATQANLERLSERAEGEKDDPPERVLSDLKGHVVLRGGIATFSNLSFSVPGALARLHGTYSLVTHEINLRGTVSMEANLSQTTKGVKSFFLKIMNPFLKKNHRGGAIMHVAVIGTYPHPVFKADPI